LPLINRKILTILLWLVILKHLLGDSENSLNLHVTTCRDEESHHYHKSVRKVLNYLYKHPKLVDVYNEKSAKWQRSGLRCTIILLLGVKRFDIQATRNDDYSDLPSSEYKIDNDSPCH
jgi:hypothetical protein